MTALGTIVLGVGILTDILIAIWVLQRTRGLVTVIKELEKNTNSIKDALILSTAESERAKGVLEGRAFAAQQRNQGPTDDIPSH